MSKKIKLCTGSTGCEYSILEKGIKRVSENQLVLFNELQDIKKQIKEVNND